MTGVDRNRKTRRQLLGLGVLGLGGVLTACAAPNRKSSEGVPGTPPGRSGASAPLTSPITLVLIHGAWHQPGPTWGLVANQLRRQGIRSVAVPLPSADPRGGERPGLIEDIAAVTAAIDAVGGPCVLVGHSYGGMVISGAGSHPMVRGLVYLAAFCLAQGETVLDIAAVNPAPLIASAIRYSNDGRMTIDPSLAIDVFYADVPPALAQSSVAALVASTADIFMTPQGPPAWKDKPSWYVVCEQDHAIPVYREHEMSQRCGKTIVLDSSHSPFLSMPTRVDEILAGVARTLA